ncbi:hypothetical protein J5N97_014353 [Dioscorea zingiberensis]|uniref:KH type-2 domain-containing protein n=1 Tax=Dioscorea zingiberensis TaxID=325984 RepID=A0A9D5CTT5_9LILI|nr:hypothetical protein J5N97_014353 [Dioscorea zingiberensis]
MSKKRKFVEDGVFFEELNKVLMRALARDGYSGVEVRVTPMHTEIIIRATHTQKVLGNLFEKGRKIRELILIVQKRFNFLDNNVELYTGKVNNKGLCAIAQAESLRYKLLGGLVVPRIYKFIRSNDSRSYIVFSHNYNVSSFSSTKKYQNSFMIPNWPQAGGPDPKGEVPPITMLELIREMHALIREQMQ